MRETLELQCYFHINILHFKRVALNFALDFSLHPKFQKGETLARFRKSLNDFSCVSQRHISLEFPSFIMYCPSLAALLRDGTKMNCFTKFLGL